MTTGNNVFTRLIAYFNDGRLDQCEQLLAPDVQFRDAAGYMASTPAEVVGWLQAWKDGFPDANITITNVVEDEDKIVCESTGVGTNTGTLQMPKGDVTATGRSVTMKTVDVVRVKDGKIQTWMAYFNPLELMEQLGLAAGAPPTDAVATLERAYAAFNAGKLDQMAACLAPDITVADSGGVNLKGVAQVKEYFQAWKTAFPDARMTITRAVQAGDTLACETRGQGTHTGPLSGPQGELPATGKSVSIPTVDFLRLANGKITEWNSYYNQADMMQQLGVDAMPSPAKLLLERMQSCFNLGDMDGFEACLASDVRFVESGGVTLNGCKAVRDYYQGWLNGFPDARMAQAVNCGENDVGIAYFKGQGTHTGPLVGPQGNIPATGKQVNVNVCHQVRVANGEITEWNSTYNQAEFMAQLGLARDAATEQRNLATVRDLYAAFMRGDVATIVKMLAPNVDWAVEAGPHSKVPWHISVSNRDDVQAFFKTLGENLEVTRFEPVEMVAMGNSVAVRLSVHSIVRKNGEHLDGEPCQWFTFDPAGLCVRWHAYTDTATAAEAWSHVAPKGYDRHAHH